MSVEFSLYAERCQGSSWALIGEPTYLAAWDCLQPTEALEISVRNPLITVLNGYLTSPWGIEHSGLEVIAEPRGLPNDLSPVLREWAERLIREELAHQPTWLKANEILDFDWHTPKIVHRGYVMADMARHFDPEQPELPFPADVWPGGWYVFASTPQGAEMLLEAQECTEEQLVTSWPRSGSQEVFWCESHYQAVGCHEDFFADLRGLGPPGAVRLVIWAEA